MKEMDKAIKDKYPFWGVREMSANGKTLYEVYSLEEGKPERIAICGDYVNACMCSKALEFYHYINNIYGAFLDSWHEQKIKLSRRITRTEA